jgi:small multidrug resistance pump
MFGVHTLALFTALLLNAAANLLMKIGMTRVQAAGGVFKDGPIAAVGTVLTTPALVIGLICFGLNACFYMFALQSKELKISIAYPIMVGGGFAIIATVGYLSLGERLNTGQMIGVGMILFGVVLVASQMAPRGV